MCICPDLDGLCAIFSWEMKGNKAIAFAVGMGACGRGAGWER